MTKPQKLLAIPAFAALLLAGGAVAGYTSLAGAQTATTGTTATAARAAGMKMMMQRGPHVDGTITAINGTTITITSMVRPGDTTTTPTTYTIDASAATFAKDGAASTLASFAVGDKIFAEGTITGTNVVATKIMSAPAFFMRGMGGPGGMKGLGGMPGKGMHDRGVMGKVTAVNGNTITVTGHDGKSYTVAAGGATVKKMVTGSLSDVVVGDTIGVEGSVSGTTVTAKTIMDDLPQMPVAAQ